MRRTFITLPTCDTIREALDWCEANGVIEPRLHMGSDGRIRGRGERLEREKEAQEE